MCESICDECATDSAVDWRDAAFGAVARGHHTCMVTIFEERERHGSDVEVPRELLCTAATFNRVKTIEWLFRHARFDDDDTDLVQRALTHAVEGGNVETVHTLLMHGARGTDDVMAYAIRGGHIDVMHRLLQCPDVDRAVALDIAASVCCARAITVLRDVYGCTVKPDHLAAVDAAAVPPKHKADARAALE